MSTLGIKLEALKYQGRTRVRHDHGTKWNPSYTGKGQRLDDGYLLRNAEIGEDEIIHRPVKIHPKVLERSSLPYNEEEWQRYIAAGDSAEFIEEPDDEFDESRLDDDFTEIFNGYWGDYSDDDWLDLMETYIVAFDMLEWMEGREPTVEQLYENAFEPEGGPEAWEAMTDDASDMSRRREEEPAEWQETLDFFRLARLYERTIESDDVLAARMEGEAIKPEAVLYAKRRGYGTQPRKDHGTGMDYRAGEHKGQMDRLRTLRIELAGVLEQEGAELGSQIDLEIASVHMEIEAETRSERWTRATEKRLRKQKEQSRSLGLGQEKEEEVARTYVLGFDGRQKPTLTPWEAARVEREAKRLKHFGRNR